MMVELAAAHGVAPICQKPLAWDMADAQAMVQACADRGLPFMVHENFRFQHPMRRIKQLLDDGAIGRPFFGRISFRTGSRRLLGPAVAGRQRAHDHRRRRRAPVRPRHAASSASHRRSSPTPSPSTRASSGEDVATVLMHMDDATCIVDASYETRSDHNTYPQTFVVLEGTEGTITLGPDYHLQVVSRGSVTDEDLVIPDHGWTSEPWNAIQDSVYTIQRHWIHCLADGRGARDVRRAHPPAARRDPRRVRVARLGRSLHRREPVLTVLHAGPLTVTYADGDLRDIRLGGAEIVRRIYVVFQDRNWTARPWTILEEDVAGRRRTPSRSSCAHGAPSTRSPSPGRGRLTGSADGTIRYADRRQHRRSPSSATGWACACCTRRTRGHGRARWRRVDGTVVETGPSRSPSPRTSPSPRCARSRHEVAPGLRATVRMTGETFESEDHRNWSDASFKHYCTPISLPFPVTVEPGRPDRRSPSRSRSTASCRRALAGPPALRIDITDDVAPAAADRHPARPRRPPPHRRRGRAAGCAEAAPRPHRRRRRPPLRPRPGWRRALQDAEADRCPPGTRPARDRPGRPRPARAVGR